MKKKINVFLVIIASLIILTYITGYNYLFKGLKLTYLRGEVSTTIDDGQFFPSRIIEKGVSKPWEKDFYYNQKPLSKDLLNHLKNTETVSFLVIKNGKIIQEHYWDSYNQNTASNSFSIAKTITVMLMGKAIEEGKIKNLEEPFSDFYDNFSKDEKGRKLTLKNLAAMESGLDWQEDYKNPFGHNAAAYYGFSVADVVFVRHFGTYPGEKFQYQSASTQLLGFAVSKAVGEPISWYASAKFWKLLGMENNARWTTDESGMEKTFCCLQSNARDFAKIGFLLLNKGKFNDLQLLNEDFVNQMITPTELSNYTYGLGIWINNESKNPHYYLQGLFGQYVIIVPKENLIIVRLGKKQAPEKDSKNRPKEVDFFIENAIKLVEN